MVNLVHSNLRDYILVVLAQFLFCNNQHRNPYHNPCYQCDRLDAADNYPGIVDK